MQALTLMDDYFEDIVKGKKLNTLRLGKRSIQKGFLKFISNRSSSFEAVVWVEEVESCSFPELAKKFDQSEESLLIRLKKSYPNITPQDTLTVVRFLSPEDTLAKHGAPPDSALEFV